MFRISNDFLVIIGLLFLFRGVRKFRKVLFILAYIGYLLLFSYNVYYPISVKLYSLHPIIQNDLLLVKEVVPIVLSEISPQLFKNYLWIFLGLIVLFIVFFFIFKWMVKSIIAIQWNVRWSAVAVLAVLFVATINYRYWHPKLPNEYQTAYWLTPKIIKSLDLKQETPYASPIKQKHYRQAFGQSLTNKPNIYLLCVESYGRIAATRADIKDTYFDNIDQLSPRLDAAGWKVASSFSTSTVSGGKSWFAFTSILSGTPLNTHMQYNDLIDNHYTYPNMVKFMNSMGYQTFRIKTFMKTNKGTSISYNRLDRWYGFDEWLKRKDFPYTGQKYDLWGGMPDQYALNYFHEEYPKNEDKPMFLFFINTSSHGPWQLPPPVLEDWRGLDTLKVSYEYGWRSSFDSLPQYYVQAINYQMDYITQFILNQAPANSLFILVGDHQPSTVVEYKEADYDTPIHFISKDAALIDSLQTFGFVEGLNLEGHNSNIHHAGIYSILQNILLSNYGDEEAIIPEYLPRGIE